MHIHIANAYIYFSVKIKIHKPTEEQIKNMDNKTKNENKHPKKKNPCYLFTKAKLTGLSTLGMQFLSIKWALSDATSSASLCFTHNCYHVHNMIIVISTYISYRSIKLYHRDSKANVRITQNRTSNKYHFAHTGWCKKKKKLSTDDIRACPVFASLTMRMRAVLASNHFKVIEIEVN